MAAPRKAKPAARPRPRRSALAPVKSGVGQLKQQLAEARAQQAATAAILKVIARSPSDVQPVFDVIVRSAMRVIGGHSAVVTRIAGDILELAALTSTSKAGDRAMKSGYPRSLSQSYFHGRAIRSRAPFCIGDTEKASGALARSKKLGRARGYRSVIVVPLLRKSEVIGTISVTRREPGPFSKHQVGLLKSFADQAVIAIENARAFRETKEALERQTATAEILKVITSSPTNLQPVFDTIVKSALALCKGMYANVFRYDGDMLNFMATESLSPRGLDFLKAKYPMRPDASQVSGRVILTKAVVRIEDSFLDPDYDPSGVRVVGWRRMLGVPMLREGAAVGVIVVAWGEPGPILAHHEELLKTFADQAVIAIENVRLFNETKEALERQTATAEILGVIASSPSDVKPVMDAIVQSAIRLVPPWNAAIDMRDGNVLRMHAAASPRAADINPTLFAEFFPIPFNPEAWELMRAIAECRVVEMPDCQATESTELGQKIARAGRYHAGVAVPLIHKGVGIGAIGLTHPQPNAKLTDKQMQLILTFANQAVIAIENVRLFNETREALERQTATAEILKVIASSPSDVQPVFDAIAASAKRLLGGLSGVVTRVIGNEQHLAAFTTTDKAGDEALRSLFPARIGERNSGRAIDTLAPAIRIDTETDSDITPEARGAARARGYRSLLAVPMIRDGVAIGTINVSRANPGPFTDHQIGLLATFADQAVIAIENVRLFNETREALEQQTATAEILQVISGSPIDTQPVFDAIVQSGLRLFPNAAVAAVLPEGNQVRLAAVATQDSAQATALKSGFPIPLSPNRMHAIAILECKLIDVPDVEAARDGPYVAGIENFLATGNRAITIAPMICDDTAIGAISVVRLTPGPLSEKQLALLRTFAAQAVIAIENVRVFKELEARTGALSRSVEQLTALGEVGRAISSTLDLETVLKSIVQRAVQLTGLDGGTIYEYDERTEEFNLRAAENLSDEIVEMLRETPMRKGEGAIGHAVETGEPTEIADMRDDSYQSPRKDFLIRAGYRALLVVPLRREDHIIGALTVNRTAPGNFSHEVVELLKTFATQSAMAIQNARLFREIEEKGRQLEVASRHKSDFLASMSHELRTPLNAILGFNEMILGQVYGDVPGDMKEPLEDIQKSGKHLLRLINNVLDLAKIEAGRMELALSDYSVQDTVESVRSTLRPLAAEKGLEFLASVSNDLPLAYGDGGRIAQCLMNLAGNWLKFTKAGKVEISVEATGELLVYKVADTGIGIPPDKIESLFTEFKQTDATIASEYGGTGLGLSISKKFIEMHGGRIWVESEPGKGSAFIFEIPLRARTS